MYAVAGVGVAALLILWSLRLAILPAFFLAVSTLVAFGLSRGEEGFFGFTERGWSPAPWAGASVFMEIATAALATAALASEVRADHTPTALRSNEWSPPPPT